MNTPRTFRGEQGASLVLALAFLTLFSVIAVSILSLTGVSVRNTGVTRSRVDQVYAADGGVEFGIQQLLDSTELCAQVSGAAAPVGEPQVINDKTVTVTCRTTNGGTTTVSGSPLLGGYVAVIGAGGITQSGDGWGTSEIHGDLYSGGPVTPGAGVWGVPRQISVVGKLDLAAAPCPPTNVTATSCTVVPNAPTVPAPQVVIPSSTAPAAPANGLDLRGAGVDCTILYPGRYPTAPVFAANRKYYLASGTYYFPSGTVTLQGQIFGGEPGEDLQRVTGASSCANWGGYSPDALAAAVAPIANWFPGGTPPFTYNAAASGTGVTLVRGGNFQFRIEDAATKVELYTRVPAPGGADNGAAPVTFWANNNATGTMGGTYSVVPANTEVFVTTDKDAEVVLHGLSYMPNSYANLREPFNTETTSPGKISFFLGGVVAKRLSIVRIFDWTFPPVPLAGTGETSTVMEPRTTTIEATATGPGGAPTTVEAVVYLPIDGSPPTIESWRKT